MDDLLRIISFYSFSPGPNNLLLYLYLGSLFSVTKMTKCPDYKRGKREDTCLKTGNKISKDISTMCRKNPENCKENKEGISLGDFCR